MLDAQKTLDQYYLEMRWRVLSLAADFDRVERAAGGEALLKSDPRAEKLRQALRIVLEAKGNRAEQLQMLLSDTTPPPERNPKADPRK
jgi:hypothetical protein